MTERESDLLESVLDGRASPAEEKEFGARLSADAALRAVWLEQVRLHVLLRENPVAIEAALPRPAAQSPGFAGGFAARTGKPLPAAFAAASQGQEEVPQAASHRILFRVAASLVLALGLAALLLLGRKTFTRRVGGDSGTSPAREETLAANQRGEIRAIQPEMSVRESSENQRQPVESSWPAVSSRTASDAEAIVAAGVTKGESMHIKAVSRALAASAVVVTSCAVPPTAALADGAGSGDTSAAFTLNADPDATLFWRTLETNAVVLHWDWPSSATAATLGVKGAEISQSFAFAPSVSNALLAFEAPVNRKKENVFTLSMVFTDSGNAVLSNKTLSAKVGLVQGVNGDGFRFIGDGEADPRWPNNYSRIVLPVSTNMVPLFLDTKTVDTGLDGAAGWHLWYKVPVGWHTLSFTNAGATVATAQIHVISQGLVISLM